MTKTTNLKPIVISAGEPSSIAPQLLLKAWLELHEKDNLCFYSVNNIQHLKEVAAKFKLEVPIVEINQPLEALNHFKKALPVLNIEIQQKVKIGFLNFKNVSFVIESLNLAVTQVLNNEASSIVTLPIEKSVMHKGGFNFIGHTEYLAYKASEFSQQKAMLNHKSSALQKEMLINPLPITATFLATENSYIYSIDNSEVLDNTINVVMMMASPYHNLKVIPVKTHMSLLDSVENLNKEDIIETISITDYAFKNQFKIKEPKFLVLGLNPHAGEDGLMGNEEIDIIKPAVNFLRDKGIKADGPIAADTAFSKENIEHYDAIVGMYHDQVLTPFKALMFHDGVNVTLGLPFVRTSPDHGTAIKIANSNKASPQSTIAAIMLAHKLVNNNA